MALTGPARDAESFVANTRSVGVPVALDDLANWTPSSPGSGSTLPTWEVPLLPSKAHAQLFAKLRKGPRFDQWTVSQGGVFPVRELDETNDRRYFRHSKGVSVWKGGSFDQYAPHGGDPAGHADWDEVLAFLQVKRGRSRTFRAHFKAAHLSDPASHPIHHARLAFRDVSRATDSRTVRACLIPPRTPLVNSAPYLVFVSGNATAQAYALGVMNSLVFDWQARRLVETHMNFFILDLLCLPREESKMEEIASRAARSSCIDDRYMAFAKEAGVQHGALSAKVAQRLRAEIDALVAHAYGLSLDDLVVACADFPATAEGLSPEYRLMVLECFKELT